MSSARGRWGRWEFLIRPDLDVGGWLRVHGERLGPRVRRLSRQEMPRQEGGAVGRPRRRYGQALVWGEGDGKGCGVLCN